MAFVPAATRCVYVVVAVAVAVVRVPVAPVAVVRVPVVPVAVVLGMDVLRLSNLACSQRYCMEVVGFMLVACVLDLSFARGRRPLTRSHLMATNFYSNPSQLELPRM